MAATSAAALDCHGKRERTADKVRVCTLDKFGLYAGTETVGGTAQYLLLGKFDDSKSAMDARAVSLCRANTDAILVHVRDRFPEEPPAAILMVQLAKTKGGPPRVYNSNHDPVTCAARTGGWRK